MSPHDPNTPAVVGTDNIIQFEKPKAKPLPSALSTTVKAFEYEILPKSFQPWIKDIAERMQCPPDFPAVSAMVVLASLVGRQIVIRPKKHDTWEVTPNLWGAVVGTPGVLKTPALKEPMTSILKFQASSLESFETEKSAFALKDIVYQEQVKLDRVKVKERLCKDSAADVSSLITAKPVPPSCKRYLVNDTTVERLQEILSENPNGVLQFRDELMGFLKQMQKAGREADRAFFLEAWNGDSSFTTDRIGRGMTHVENACVSLLGGIQPSPLQNYFAGIAHGGGNDDGLLQRFQLLVWPDVSGEWENVDRSPDVEAKDRAHSVFKRLKDTQTADGGRSYLHFTESAQVLFDNWRADLEARLRSGSEAPALEGHLAKYRSLVPSLALLIHLANNDSGSVCYECTTAALAWVDYLESHARRIYDPSLDPAMQCAKALAAKIKEGKLGKKFTIRDVYRPNWSNLTNSEQAKDAVNILINHHWLTTIEEKTDGPIKTVYEVNQTVSEL